ncbi:MAG: aldo/keto reductase [Gemmatimonadota bacterium]
MADTPTPVTISPGGPRFSPIVAGAWRMADWGFAVPARQRWIEHCLELGITTFDHADIYGDYQVEGLFGEVLAASPALRQQMQLVTKCGIKLPSTHRPTHTMKSYDTSRAHVRASVESSLRALRTDYVDLLLIHRADVLMDPAELADTFRELRDAGKIGHFGVSNHTPSQLALLHRHIPLVTNQVELSPLQLDTLTDGTLDQCIELAIRPMIWSPLGGGRLMTSQEETAVRVRETLDVLARSRGVSAVTIAYAWLLRHPARPLPITGSRRLEALREAIAALDVTLSSDDWYRIWEAGAGREVA